jgi:AcrR family transcriptional regulator
MNPSTDDPSSSMRRVPQQERSRQKVDAMVDAAERLIGEHGWDALSTSEIAEAAGVSVATLYQFFPDKRAIAQVVAHRFVDRFVAEVEGANAAQEAADAEVWWSDIDRTWAAIAKLNRESAAFARIQFGDSIDLHLLDDELTNSEVVIARLGDVHGGGPAPDDPEVRLVMTVLVTAVGPLFTLAFRDNPDGDPAVLREITTLVRGYILTKFADQLPRDDAGGSAG